MKVERKSVPASGGKDACSADGFSPIAPLYLPSMFTCLRARFFCSAAFETEKMMKRPACWEFALILGFRCLQGRRQWQSQYSSLCIASLLFSPCLSVLFLWIYTLFLWFCFALSFPVSVSCVFCLFFFVCEFSGEGERRCPLSYLFPSLAYQRMAPNASVSFRRNRGTNFSPLFWVFSCLGLAFSFFSLLVL